MSERKAINKWYPPDYDPNIIPKKKKRRTGNLIIKIRMMTPYSMRCLKCNEYIAQRRSFNARKETLPETYLSTRIIRFHITCPACNNPITFKTNPQTAGYTPENGAVRNFESSATSSAGSRLQKSKIGEETEDEILERLVREEEENKKYQELKEKRKKNPFWNKAETNTNNDVFENLQEKLQQQQQQQMAEDQLEQIQAKREEMVENESQLIANARERLLQQEEDALRAFRQKKDERKSERKTVSSIISVRKRDPREIEFNRREPKKEIQNDQKHEPKIHEPKKHEEIYEPKKHEEIHEPKKHEPEIQNDQKHEPEIQNHELEIHEPHFTHEQAKHKDNELDKNHGTDTGTLAALVSGYSSSEDE